MFLTSQENSFFYALRFIWNVKSELLTNSVYKKYIFRDLKPANFLLRTRGRGKVWEEVPVEYTTCKLADFGLAKWFDLHKDLRNMSLTLTTVGTPTYMAPEIFAALMAKKGTSKYRSSADMYSAGLISFELMFKELPSKFYGITFPLAEQQQKSH